MRKVAGTKKAAVSTSFPVVLWRHFSTSFLRYNEIDGEQRAASFAYYAFFSLFPLIVLLVTTVGGSLLKDQAQASKAVTQLLQQYIPLSPKDQLAIVKTIDGVIAGRGSAGIVAILTLAWSSLRFFQALVRGVNRAWGTREYAWWHLPLKNTGMVGLLASGMVLGVILPAILSVGQRYVATQFWVAPVLFRFAFWAVPLVILYYVLALFYKYAPRASVSLRDVWLPALIITLLLKLVQYLFAIYLTNYSNFGAIYGTFAVVTSLLLWIYVSGSLVIFGGCLCAVKKEFASTAAQNRQRKK